MKIKVPKGVEVKWGKIYRPTGERDGHLSTYRPTPMLGDAKHYRQQRFAIVPLDGTFTITPNPPRKGGGRKGRK